MTLSFNKWLQVAGAGLLGPSPRAYVAAAYADTFGMFVFGGSLDGSSAIDNGLWLLDTTGVWQNSSTMNVVGTPPSARWGNGCAWDPSRSELHIIGGYNSALQTDHFILKVTGVLGSYVYTWRQVTSVNPVPAGANSSTCYDVGNDTVYHWPGQKPIGSLCAELWAFQPSTGQWDASPVSTITGGTAPSARINTALMYDLQRNLIVLLGGTDFSSGFSDTHYETDLANWFTPDTSGSLPAIAAQPAAACPSTINGEITVVGITTVGVVKDDVWTLESTVSDAIWTKPDLFSKPTAVYDGALVYDTDNSRYLRFGGFTLASGVINELWTSELITVTSVVVTPDAEDGLPGTTQQLTATATYSDSTVVDVTDVADWETDNSDVVTVNSTGLVTRVGAGSADILAFYGGQGGSQTFNVQDEPVVPAVPFNLNAVSDVSTVIYDFSGTMMPSVGRMDGIRYNPNRSKVVLTSSYDIDYSVSYGLKSAKTALDASIFGNDPPSWAQTNLGGNYAYVQPELAAPDHEENVLNAFYSGSQQAELSDVPAFADQFYSKQKTLRTLTVKVTASDGLVSGSWPYTFGGIEINPAIFVGTNSNPLSVPIHVNKSGKIVDLKVWVEIFHVSASDTVPPLDATTIAIRSPNLTWGNAHPIQNDPIVNKFGRNVEGAIYSSSFLLWESTPAGSGPINTQRYPAWGKDRGMRTVFVDGATTPNPRELYSRTSPSGNFIGAPNSFFGQNSAYGNDVPWVSADNLFMSGAYHLTGSPPPGWLTGPGGTAADDEWPTTGSNYGAVELRPVYPFLDTLYCKKFYDPGENSAILPWGSPGLSYQENYLSWRGFRPGLRGTEMSGTWNFMIGMKFDGSSGDGGMLGLFRQVRLEITYEEHRSLSYLRNHASRNALRAGERQLYFISGSSPSNEDASTGPGVDYFVNGVYSTVDGDCSIGKSFGLVVGTGSIQSDNFALLWQLSGTLADAIGSAPYWLTNSFNGMPNIPDLSASLILSENQLLLPKAPVVPVLSAINQNKSISPTTRLFELAQANNKPLKLEELARKFASGSQ